MTHRGPFQPRPFCDSVILCCLINRGQNLAPSAQPKQNWSSAAHRGAIPNNGEN